jgi:nitrogen fixation/metabolism regulation signal transduction histidine kinase
MKIKVFLIVCLGAAIMLLFSSILVYTQMRAMQNISFDTLTESLYNEDSTILSWILSSVSTDRIDTMKLPDSWAEIFVVNNNDLVVASSTNQSHKGLPLHRHPELLDQAPSLIEAMKAGKPTALKTSQYMVVIHPTSADQTIVALKPKAWEKGLVSQQDAQIRKDRSAITRTLLIFLGIGLFIAILISFLIAFIVVNPTRKLLNAFEALSLGDFDYEIKEAWGEDMKTFTESFLRLKASLVMALERISRR